MTTKFGHCLDRKHAECRRIIPTQPTDTQPALECSCPCHTETKEEAA